MYQEVIASSKWSWPGTKRSPPATGWQYRTAAKGVDSAEWIPHALNQKIFPRPDHQRGCDRRGETSVAGCPTASRRPKNALNQIASHASAGIEHRENEQRLEHHREVIPKILTAPPTAVRENVRHADRQRGCAAGATEQGFLAELMGQRHPSGRRSPESHAK